MLALFAAVLAHASGPEFVTHAPDFSETGVELSSGFVAPERAGLPRVERQPTRQRPAVAVERSQPARPDPISHPPLQRPSQKRISNGMFTPR